MHPSAWLTRYRNGERSRVWQEMGQLGATIHETPLAEEAQLVCQEMAHRARQNIEVIVQRLRDDGYRFHCNDAEQTPTIPVCPGNRGCG